MIRLFSRRPSTKPLVIGVGAPKAGTTWLAQYFNNRPDCSRPPLKEMHFFNNLSEDGLKKLSTRIERRMNEMNPEPNQRRRMEHYKALVDAGRSSDADYLSALRFRVPEETLKYEFTPAYALLGEDILRRMNALTEDVRFIYLLRDPIDRTWSQARMMAMQRSGLGKDRVWAKEYTEEQLANMIADANQIVASALSAKSANVLKFSRYSETLLRLKSAVPEKNLYIGFFEELFDQREIKRICKFLGLSFVAADFEATYSYSFNAKMETELKERLMEYFAVDFQETLRLVGRTPSEWKPYS